MSKNIGELKALADELGIKVKAAGKKLSKEDYEVALRDFLWNRDHRGEQMMVQVEPQLAKNVKDADKELADEAWEDCVNRTSGYVGQPKLDGCRFLAHVTKDKIRFTSRRISDKTFLYSEKTENFPFLQYSAIMNELEGTIFDGEIKMPVALIDTGAVKTVTELQATVAVSNSSPEVSLEIQKKYGSPKYHVFDVLAWKGRDVTSEPYWKRLEYLAVFFSTMKPENWVEVVSFYEKKKLVYETTVKAGGEGIMLKALGSRYESGARNWNWMKVKKFEEVDCFVTGIVASDEDKQWADLVGALEVSVIDEATGKERAVACVSSMPLEMRKAITETVNGKPTLKKEIYGKVVVVRGQEWTKNIRLKHAVMVIQNPSNSLTQYYRFDKAADKCTMNFKEIENTVAAGERA